ncbi:OmpA family protein, partial [Mesorhizobium sp. M7A.F.Ca.CA.002.15.1.1]
MLTRRTLAAALIAAIAMPSLAAAQATTPSAATIERKLEAA